MYFLYVCSSCVLKYLWSCKIYSTSIWDDFYTNVTIIIELRKYLLFYLFYEFTFIISIILRKKWVFIKKMWVINTCSGFGRCPNSPVQYKEAHHNIPYVRFIRDNHTIPNYFFDITVASRHAQAAFTFFPHLYFFFSLLVT